MMIGHSMLAFALAAFVASRFYSNQRALVFGLVAGVFAAVPDIDMAYALFGVANSDFSGVFDVTHSFWESSTVSHRAVTHSLVIAVPAAIAFVSLTRESLLNRVLGVSALALLVLSVSSITGAIDGAMMALFAVAGTFVAVLASHFGVNSRDILGASLLGLLTHPFGDVFTGTPPDFLYPFDFVVLAERIAILPEPTLNLVSIFVVEIATIWLAVLVFARLTDRNLIEYVNYRAAVGVTYATAALVLPAPTLDVSYHFVFSVLALGFVSVDDVVPFSFRRKRDDARTRLMKHVCPPEKESVLAAFVTGLTAISLGVLAYAAVYIALI